MKKSLRILLLEIEKKFLRRLTQSKLLKCSLDKTSLLGESKAVLLWLIPKLVDYIMPARIDRYQRRFKVKLKFVDKQKIITIDTNFPQYPSSILDCISSQ